MGGTRGSIATLLLLCAAARWQLVSAVNCCGSDALACSVACTGCSACAGCLGWAALLPTCWLCAACSGCAATCTEFLSCIGTTQAQCNAAQNTLTHGGRIRDFKMGPTSCASPPCPLVLVLHGWTMTTDMMPTVTQMGASVSAGTNGGAVVVYPDGTGSGVLSCWRVPGATALGGCGNARIDDVGFISSLIDLMVRRYSIDTNRIYAMGFSNGGAMTMQLACKLSHKIAAFGIVGAGPLTSVGGALAINSWSCPWRSRSGQIPILWIHGANDFAAPYGPAASSSAALASRLGYSEV